MLHIITRRQRMGLGEYLPIWGKLNAAEREKIDQALVKLAEVIQGDNRRAINLTMDALVDATNEFAARRMDQSIRRALAGKKVTDVADSALGAAAGEETQ